MMNAFLNFWLYLGRNIFTDNFHYFFKAMQFVYTYINNKITLRWNYIMRLVFRY